MFNAFCRYIGGILERHLKKLKKIDVVRHMSWAVMSVPILNKIFT